MFFYTVCCDVLFKEVKFKGDESTATPLVVEPSDLMKIRKDAYDPNLQSDFKDDLLEAEIDGSGADKKEDGATTTHSGRLSRNPQCLGD